MNSLLSFSFPTPPMGDVVWVERNYAQKALGKALHPGNRYPEMLVTFYTEAEGQGHAGPVTSFMGVGTKVKLAAEHEHQIAGGLGHCGCSSWMLRQLQQ